MKYDDLCAHIAAKREVRIAGYSKHMRGMIGIPLRIFKKLQGGRIRRYVEVRARTGQIRRADICRVRNMADLVGVM